MQIAKLQGTEVLVEQAVDPGTKNCAVQMYWQLGQPSDEFAERAVIDLFDDIIQEPLFDTLRTKQQLGYDVSCSVHVSHDVLGWSISLQSSNSKPLDIVEKIMAFLKSFRAKIAELNHERMSS